MINPDARMMNEGEARKLVAYAEKHFLAGYSVRPPSIATCGQWGVSQRCKNHAQTGGKYSRTWYYVKHLEPLLRLVAYCQERCGQRRVDEDGIVESFYRCADCPCDPWLELKVDNAAMAA